MKRLIILILIIVSAMVYVSCKKCVTCTEHNSQTTSHYCGTPADVQFYEDELKTSGSNLGQNWTCISD